MGCGTSPYPISTRRAFVVAVSILTLVGLAFGFPAPLRTQPSRPPGFAEKVEVNVVNVEVFVTDRQGNPVTDLTARDFEILEDGKKMKLSNFLALEGAGGDAERAGAGETPGAGALSAPGEPGRVVLVVDNFSIHRQNRRQVLDRLRRFVEQGIDEGYHYALASYDGHLRIRQPFTSDPNLLVAAISDLEELSPLGTQRRAERDALLRSGLATLSRIVNIPADDLLGRGQEVPRYLRAYSDEVELYAASIRAENQAAFVALSHLVNGLAAVPGRKALVFVSDGLEMQPAEELFHAISEAGRSLPSELTTADSPDARQAQTDQRSSALGAIAGSAPGGSRRRTKKKAANGDLLTLTALANSSRVSFYTIRALGDLGGVPAELAGVAAKLYTPQLRGIRENNLAETLKVMAAETGGLARSGFEIGDLLGTAQREISSHYSLGYEPPHAGDGRFHRIKVKVKRKGARVRSRTGYIDKNRESRLADGASAALLLEIGDNPHGLGIFPGRGRATDRKRLWLVPVMIEIPIEHLTLLPQGNGVLACEGELYLAAEDPSGATAPVQRFPLRIEVDEENLEQARGGAFSTQLELALREGPQRLAFGFSDPAGGLSSFVSRDLTVGRGASGK